MKLNYRNSKNAMAVASYWGKSLDKQDWYSIKALDGGTTEIFIYDVIGWPWCDAGELVQHLATVRDKPVVARINSPGGDCFDGLSIYNALANHPGGITIRIEGMAASMASVIAMAGGKNVEAYSNTMMMVHNAWIYAAGNHHELREIADISEKISGQMADIYIGKTKTGIREMKQLMDAETYMTAEEAKKKGFISTILKSGQGAKAEFDLPFAHIPDYFKGSKELTERDAEKALRDAGFSRNKAKSMLAGRLRDGSAEEDGKNEAGKEDVAVCTDAINQIIKNIGVNK